MSSKRRTELQEFVCNGDRIFTGLCTGVRKERMTIMNNSERIYVDFHVLQTVPPSCVNRDDTGSPKTAIYGGVTRVQSGLETCYATEISGYIVSGGCGTANQNGD